MAHTPFELQILTPEGHVFSGDVEFISTRTESGAIGIYARHEPLLALLAPSELHVQLPDGELKVFAQGEGYIQVSEAKVLVLVEEAIEPKALDTSELAATLEDARGRRAQAAPGSADFTRAQRDERRAAAFLEVAKAA